MTRRNPTQGRPQDLEIRSAPEIDHRPAKPLPPRAVTDTTKDTPRAAVVTGAGRGIGRAIALDLAQLGYKIALQSRTEAQLESTRQAIEGLGGQARVVPGDVTDPEAATRLIEVCEAELGPVAVAVAGAGQAFSSPLKRNDPDRVRRLFEVNTLSAFHLVQRAAEAMVASKTRGRIVVVASSASVSGAPYTSAYSATKHAVLGLVKSAALELAGKGITVNALCPGWVDTEMFDETLKNIMEKTGCALEEARARITQNIPMREVLTVEEVAGMLRYLVSPEARHLTGQALVLDGGETLG